MNTLVLSGNGIEFLVIAVILFFVIRWYLDRKMDEASKKKEIEQKRLAAETKLLVMQISADTARNIFLNSETLKKAYPIMTSGVGDRFRYAMLHSVVGVNTFNLNEVYYFSKEKIRMYGDDGLIAEYSWTQAETEKLDAQVLDCLCEMIINHIKGKHTIHSKNAQVEYSLWKGHESHFVTTESARGNVTDVVGYSCNSYLNEIHVHVNLTIG